MAGQSCLFWILTICRTILSVAICWSSSVTENKQLSKHLNTGVDSWLVLVGINQLSHYSFVIFVTSPTPVLRCPYMVSELPSSWFLLSSELGKSRRKYCVSQAVVTDMKSKLHHAPSLANCFSKRGLHTYTSSSDAADFRCSGHSLGSCCGSFPFRTVKGLIPFFVRTENSSPSQSTSLHSILQFGL
jgi:hypothetical protein